MVAAAPHAELSYYVPRRFVGWCSPRPGRASDYIRAVDTLERGTRIVLVLRVSEWEQKLSGSLHRQMLHLRHEAEKRGLIVVGEVMVVWAGSDPIWLKRAVAIAQREDAAAIVAADTTRLIRSPHYRPGRQDMPPTDEDFAWLLRFTDGITLVTIADPDANPRSIQTARGMQAVGNNGRPRAGESKRARRIRLMRPRVLELAAAGVPKHEIARRLNLPRRTVQRWLEGRKTDAEPGHQSPPPPSE